MTTAGCCGQMERLSNFSGAVDTEVAAWLLGSCDLLSSLLLHCWLDDARSFEIGTTTHVRTIVASTHTGAACGHCARDIERDPPLSPP